MDPFEGDSMNMPSAALFDESALNFTITTI